MRKSEPLPYSPSSSLHSWAQPDSGRRTEMSPWSLRRCKLSRSAQTCCCLGSGSWSEGATSPSLHRCESAQPQSSWRDFLILSNSCGFTSVVQLSVFFLPSGPTEMGRVLLYYGLIVNEIKAIEKKTSVLEGRVFVIIRILSINFTDNN